MHDAIQLIEEWHIEYNTERPHSSLGYPLVRLERAGQFRDAAVMIIAAI
ncbi:integrase core domain-containing protein [Burkholderia ubonensis]